MTPPEFDFDSVEPAQFAQLVAASAPEQLAEMMSGEFRGKILDTIFKRMQDQYDPGESIPVDIVAHFVITRVDDGDADKYQVKTKDGTCVTSNQLTEDPGLTLTLDAVDFLKLSTGAVGSAALYIDAKLKIDGNIMLANRIMQHFKLPQARAAEAADSSAPGGN